MDFSKYTLFPEEFVNELVYSMQTVGYYVIEDFYDESICNYLKDILENAIDNYKPHEESERSFKDKYHMHDLLLKDINFSKTFEDPRLQQLVGSILGENWIMYAYTSSSLPPNGNNFGSRMHVDSPRFISNYPTNVGVIWALDEFNVENGATFILPGSHNSGNAPTEAFFKKNCIRLTCKKGAFILFNARMWHAAGNNSTDYFRHALTLNACRPYMKQRMDWVRFIPQSIVSQLNDQARRIIGYDTRLPSSLEEFFLPENERLYKGGQE
jgi:ectoine hydroxylase-related dioxygenase (phytanoyl-CoA dioxygenase family)